jgi:hypothetical protein
MIAGSVVIDRKCNNVLCYVRIYFSVVKREWSVVVSTRS